MNKNANEDLIKFYDKEYVQEYENKPINRLSNLINLIDLDQHFNVVDFACGNGMLMELVAPNVNSYIGVDFSDLFINAANKRKERFSFKNVDFICSDINDFCSLNINKFDVGFAMDFTEHVSDNELNEMLTSMHKSLKKGGKLYAHTPNATFLLEILKDKNLIFKQFPEHIAVRNSRQYIKLFQSAGFSIVNIKFIPHYNSLRILHPLSFIPIIGKYFEARLFIEAIV